MKKKNKKRILEKAVSRLDRHKHEWGILSKETNFSRAVRKMSFRDVIKSVMGFQSHSNNKELLRFCEFDKDRISASGFYKARKKVKPEAFMMLMEEINKLYPGNKMFKGYDIATVDGSDINIRTDKDDKETHSPLQEGSKGYNNFHLNCSYDPLNLRYTDAIIQPMRLKNEIAALVEMAKRDDREKVIYIADRGYESYNTFEDSRNAGKDFVTRAKDITSYSAISAKIPGLPKEEEFDVTVTFTITSRKDKETKANPDKFLILKKNRNFKYINDNHRDHTTTWRVTRFKISDEEKYETLISSLPEDIFTTDDIKKLYHLRWKIETSYKHLKYSADVNVLHSKDKTLIQQEIFAKLVLFNISMILINEATKNIKQCWQYEYKINVSIAMFIIQNCITKRKEGFPSDLLELIAKEIVPIRPDRQCERNIRVHSFIPFNYRFN